jgi:hypothetical protein
MITDEREEAKAREENVEIEALSQDLDKDWRAGRPTHIKATRLREMQMVSVAHHARITTTPVWFSEVTPDEIIRRLRETGIPEARLSMLREAAGVNFAVMAWSSLVASDCGRRTSTRFNLSEGLAYKLMATDLKGVVAADLKLPVNSFYIELPPGLIYQYDHRTGWHEVRILVVTEGTITEEIRARVDASMVPTWLQPLNAGRRLVIEAYGSPNSASKAVSDDSWLFQSYDVSDPTQPVDANDEADPRSVAYTGRTKMRLGIDGQILDPNKLRRFLFQFVLNFCIYLGSDRATRRLRHAAEIETLLGGKKRKNLRQSVLDRIVRLEKDRVFDVGTEVQIDNEFKSYVRTGKGTGASLTYRVLVRGHWRNQAHGPAMTLRKQKWIEPHIRGTELPTKVVGHTYVIKEDT